MENRNLAILYVNFFTGIIFKTKAAYMQYNEQKFKCNHAKCFKKKVNVAN